MKEIVLFEELMNTDQGAEKVMRISYDEDDLLKINAYDDIAIVLPRTIDYRNLDQITEEEVKELLKTPIKGILSKINNHERVTIKNSGSIEDEIKLLRRNSKEYRNNENLLSFIQKNIIEHEQNKLKSQKNI
jgi:nucleoid DNA-binding protein